MSDSEEWPATSTSTTTTYTLISAGSGISGDFDTVLVGGGSATSGLESFLIVTTSKVDVSGGAQLLNVTEGLIWEEKLNAHGTFNVASGTFTLNYDLADNSTTSAGDALSWGGSSLTKVNSGTLVLNGANTYTGETVVSGGTLRVTGTLGSGALYSGTIDNAATLEFDQSANQTLAGSISGNGTLIKAGSGILTLVSTITVSQDNVTLEGGVMVVEAGGSVFAGDTFVAGSGATLGMAMSAVINAGTATIGGAILDIQSYGDLNSGLTEWPASAMSSYTLISTVSGIDGEFARILGGGVTSSLDSFLTVTARKYEDGNVLKVATGLVWEEKENAHGTFNVASGTFTLHQGLANNATTHAGNAFVWNGSSMTTVKSGTLILAGANT
jgi:autotransporter-associated beta strand protein